MTSSQQRLAYIDWMRGLACVLMFQTHCYDSWLSAEAKRSEFFRYSQMGGTLPAPLFVFLSGVSVALVTDKLRQAGATRSAIAKQVMLRGAEVFGLGILFRVQEYLLGIHFVPWTDLLRVDVLNILGLSMILMAGLCWAVGAGAATAGVRIRTMVAALLAAAAVAMLTPALWTIWRPRFLPWPIESYVNGVHVFDQPQAWLFPIFPWTAFAFAGLAVGFWLLTDFSRRREAGSFVLLGALGAAAYGVSLLLDRSPLGLPGVYDYWHSSPNFFLARCGVLLGILFAAYPWCRWGWAQVGFSPMVQLGKTSLLVYWVHIEFVYGWLSILPKGKCGIGLASAGLGVIFLAMLGLSAAKTNFVKRSTEAVKQRNATA